MSRAQDRPGSLSKSGREPGPDETSRMEPSPIESTGRARSIASVVGKCSSERLITSTGPRDISASGRLELFLSKFQSDDRVLIVISADPDAIASAVAIKRLLWRRVNQTVVASVNNVKRPDNLQLIEALHLKLEPLASLEIKSFTRLVMVDSQPQHSPKTERLPFDVVIDHHPRSLIHPDVPHPAFADIRPDLGATATMMVGYLKAAKIKPNQKLATALFYAIKTDTKNFVRQGQLEDMNAFRWLYPFIQPQILSDIERAPIAKSSFKMIVKGLNGTVFIKNMAFTFLEKADHPDSLVIMADFLLKIKTVNCSVAAGVCGRNKLVIIFRSGSRRHNVGQQATAAFENYGSAGGHKSMARAEIPMENLDPKSKKTSGGLKRFILRRLNGDNV